MKEQQEFIAEGFSFASSNDAQLAVKERKKIEYLEAHMDYDKPENILTVYEKAIDDRVFKTPVGILYLKKIRDYLANQPDIDPDQLIPVPVYSFLTQEIRETPVEVRPRVQAPASAKDKKRGSLRISVILNIALIITVIAMFLMALDSEQPNIINYRRAITNQYASWEQELTAREQAVREKERELRVEEGLEK